MMLEMIIVPSPHLLQAGEKEYRCAIGKGGFVSDKREGDGGTPVGEFALRRCWYRPDKLASVDTRFPTQIISQADGWSDDPAMPDYNRHVSLPYEGSHELLWREDELYDVFVEIAYNDEQVVAGKGSAIFLHCAKPDYEPTEGCVALARADLLELLQHIGPQTRIQLG